MTKFIGTLSRSHASHSSGSTASRDARRPSGQPPARGQRHQQVETDTSDDESADEARDLPTVPANRPASSVSSHRYRTPMAGSLAMSPPPLPGVPITQPLPGFETPSAFAEPLTVSSPSSVYPTTSSYVGQFSETSRHALTSPPNIYPAHPNYLGPAQSLPMRVYGPARPPSRPMLERAIENVQAHLAALTERLESLESVSRHPSRSNISLSPRGARSPSYGPRSPADGRARHHEWDLEDLGMWSLVLNPLSRGVDSLKELATFFARNENRSPTLIIVRRLCLDVSFLLCVLALVRTIWKRSGVRRREVRAALIVLWRALLGTKERVLVDRGV